jgi:cell division protein FtsL
MSWKLAVLILVLGATACALLVLRQQEIDMLAAQWDLRGQVSQKEQLLQSLRWEIDELSRDERLHEWVARTGLDLRPLEFEPRFQPQSNPEEGPIALDGDLPATGQGG